MSDAITVTVVSRTGSLQMNRGLNIDAGFLVVHTSRQDKICHRLPLSLARCVLLP